MPVVISHFAVVVAARGAVVGVGVAGGVVVSAIVIGCGGIHADGGGSEIGGGKVRPGGAIGRGSIVATVESAVPDTRVGIAGISEASKAKAEGEPAMVV